MHLSLSLSLSCRSSRLGLAAESDRVSSPLVGRKNCCHAHDDDRHPRSVASDRTLAFTATIGRQAHCEWTSRAPGGVAGTPPASSLEPTFAYIRFRGASVCHAPGGVAGTPHASSSQRAFAYERAFVHAGCRGVLSSRAPGRIAELKLASAHLRDLSAGCLGVATISRAPGGVAEPKLASVYPKLSPARRVGETA